MHFEAESNGSNYEVNVNENKTTWRVSLREKDNKKNNWVHYDIPKNDYQTLNDTISFIFKQRSYLIDVVGSDNNYTVYTRGSHRTIKIYNDESLLHQSLKAGGSLSGDSIVESGMPGKIVKVFVKAGDKIKKSDPLLIMEAMKMENEIRATHDAKIKDVKVKAGQNVEAGTELIVYE